MGGFLTPMHRKQAAAQLYALQQKENEAKQISAQQEAEGLAANSAQKEPAPQETATPPVTDPLSSLFSSYEKEGESA